MQAQLSKTLLESAIEATRRACEFDRPAGSVLSEFFRQHRELGSHQRRLIADTAFSVIRHKRLLEAIVPQPDSRRIVLSALMISLNMPLSALKPLLSKPDHDWLLDATHIDTATLPPAVRLSMPDWLWQRLQAQYGKQRAIRLGTALLTPAPVDLRVNTLVSGRNDVLRALTSDGIVARPTPYSPIGIRLEGKPSLSRHELFLNGAIEVQDEGSQLLGLLVAPTRRQMVVDFCAGTGGKTLLLGAMMHNQGRLYAHDISAKRLEVLKQRAMRAKLTNVHPMLIGGERDPRIQRLAGRIDQVLVDAPCSGLGTLRRSPELKWRTSPASLREMVEKQRRLLDTSSQLVKPGGRLVYATCSLLAEENVQVVEAFLEAQNGRYRLLDCQPMLGAQKIAFNCGTYFQVTPDEHDCDGFFAAVLQHRSGP